MPLLGWTAPARPVLDLRATRAVRGADGRDRRRHAGRHEDGHRDGRDGRRQPGRARPGRIAGDAAPGPGQFRLGQVASAAPPAGAERAARAAGGDRSRGRFRLAGRSVRPCRGRRHGEPARAPADRAARAPAPRLGGAQSRGTRRRRAVACHGRLPRRAVRGRARPLVPDAGRGRRGAALRARHGGRGLGRSAPALARGDDQPDVPGPQARPRRRDRDAASRQARQERRGGSLELPDGPHLPRHRHAARRRPARHGPASGRDVPRSRARPVRRARAGAVEEAAAGPDRPRRLGRPRRRAEPAAAARAGAGGCQQADLHRGRGRGCAGAWPKQPHRGRCWRPRSSAGSRLSSRCRRRPSPRSRWTRPSAPRRWSRS